MHRYKILVVDDSAFMRRIISDIIAEDPQFHVIDTARNGAEAVQKTLRHRPDAVTMDVEMPEMNGIEALRRIMDQCPTPVVMLSSQTQEGAAATVEALESGAVDFVPKPSGSISLDLNKVKQLILDRLHIAVKANIRPAAPMKPAEAIRPVSAAPRPDDGRRHLVAIGTSTGGPRALQAVLTRLPPSFPAPIVIVQHMPPNFTRSLAMRLNQLCAIRVVEAEDGMPLVPATAYIAPGGRHMTVVRRNGYAIALHDGMPLGGHRPSVDVLFESLLPFRELKRHIVLMTGMGSDGARAMKALRDGGAATTIAEAESTCVVFGMPRSAIELGGAEWILPLEAIAERLVRAVGA
jgi:two-component system chemotaxis response regulator CheB